MEIFFVIGCGKKDSKSGKGSNNKATADLAVAENGNDTITVSELTTKSTSTPIPTATATSTPTSTPTVTPTVTPEPTATPTPSVDPTVASSEAFLEILDQWDNDGRYCVGSGYFHDCDGDGLEEMLIEIYDEYDLLEESTTIYCYSYKNGNIITSSVVSEGYDRLYECYVDNCYILISLQGQYMTGEYLIEVFEMINGSLSDKIKYTIHGYEDANIDMPYITSQSGNTEKTITNKTLKDELADYGISFEGHDSSYDYGYSVITYSFSQKDGLMHDGYDEGWRWTPNTMILALYRAINKTGISGGGV